MKKRHFTRKNLICCALVFFYLLIVTFCTICVDANNPIMKANNPIQYLGRSLGFPDIKGSVGAWLLVVCNIVYILIFTLAFIYEMRLAIYYEGKRWTKKWIIVYSVTLAICLVLSTVIGILAQYPYNPEYIKNSYLLLVEGLVTGLIIYAALLCLIGGAIVLYVNFKNIDKPFRFFEDRDEDKKLAEVEAKELEEATEQGKLAESFGETSVNGDINNNASPNQNNLGGNDLPRNENIGDLVKEKVFPGLCEIDSTAQLQEMGVFEDNLSLSEICDQFRKYLAKEEKLYFDEKTIRAFIAGLGTSRLIILEGLSGTGKSSIARYFSEFVSEKSFFSAVQTTWRDRTSILGFYNDFSKSYNETEFLKRLYEYSYKENHINIMVLDEMNISRIEYYFADFLSVLEYPIEDWKLKIMQLPYGFMAPYHLEDGILQIPANTIFIGTANKDDSTYTITDKVYDRAITLSFDDKNDEFEVEGDVHKIAISYDYFRKMCDEAINNDSFKLSKEELAKFKEVTDFAYEAFDLTFGNRIQNQIVTFTPIFVSCGGKKEEALDFMFARKVIAKLEGRYEDYVKKGLEGLLDLLKKTYKEGTFSETEHLINKLLRRF
jgi:hypothetical protein